MMNFDEEMDVAIVDPAKSQAKEKQFRKTAVISGILVLLLMAVAMMNGGTPTKGGFDRRLQLKGSTNEGGEESSEGTPALVVRQLQLHDVRVARLSKGGTFRRLSSSGDSSDGSSDGSSNESSDDSADERPAPAPAPDRPAPVPPPVPGPVTCEEMFYTTGDVVGHADRADCWYILYNVVYDFTDYVDRHPGGPTRVFQECGTDATQAFSRIHDQRTVENAGTSYIIGKLGSSSGMQEVPC
jgi:cytochrome b involved in lipid metabolism